MANIWVDVVFDGVCTMFHMHTMLKTETFLLLLVFACFCMCMSNLQVA